MSKLFQVACRSVNLNALLSSLGRLCDSTGWSINLGAISKCSQKLVFGIENGQVQTIDQLKKLLKMVARFESARTEFAKRQTGRVEQEK